MVRLRYGLFALVLLAGCAPEEKKLPPPGSGQPQGEAKVDDRNTSRPAESVIGQAYRAGKRAGLLQEMDQIGKTITATVLVDDRMPTAADIKADLQRSAAKYAALIDDGTIILTDTKSKTGLWAYEIDADKAGGIVLVGGVAERKTADEVKALLKMK